MIANIQISFQTAVSRIKQILAIYAKRAKDKSGGVLFQDFTISTAEENACKVYVQYAVNSVISDVLEFVQGTTISSSGITFNAKNTRWQSESDSDFQQTLSDHIYTFAALFTVSKIFQSVAPSLVKVIEDDANGAKRDIHDLFYFKYGPSVSSKEPEDVKAIIAPT